MVEWLRVYSPREKGLILMAYFLQRVSFEVSMRLKYGKKIFFSSSFKEKKSILYYGCCENVWTLPCERRKLRLLTFPTFLFQ